MKISKYEEKILRLLNKDGLKEENKKLDRQEVYNVAKIAFAYSFSVLSLGMGGFAMLDSAYKMSGRPKLEMMVYEDNQERINELNKMKKEIDAAWVVTLDSELKKEISDKLEETSIKIEEMNLKIENSSRYISQLEEKKNLTNKFYAASGMFLLGLAGVAGAPIYQRRLKKNLKGKKQMLNSYFNKV